METQNYKRTVAGSVGAGMGALFGASGKTYFILEHKTPSKYHQVGEAQKIIVDQIELGRDASCQIRYDETFDTVSRKHAAIERDGDGWKLIHLSNSNPTLVNGRPISGTYYLQNGDEIQLSVNGPRLGFIVPQGKQALTSSIGLTERMNLFRHQALRPYKRAITAMSVLFVLAIGALVFWNVKLDKDNEMMSAQLQTYQVQLDSLDNEKARLIAQQQILEQKVKEGDEAARTRLQEVHSRISNVDRNIYNVNKDIEKLKTQDENKDAEEAKGETAKAETKTEEQQTTTTTPEAPAATTASANLKDYYDYIYTMKIDKIDVENNGRSSSPGIALSDIICGTGFMLDNGTFVTDRQNIEPWVYTEGETQREDWRRKMAEYVAGGANVIIHYTAYSAKGTGRPLRFTNRDFSVDHQGDVNMAIEIQKPIRNGWKEWFGITLGDSKPEIKVMSPRSSSYGYIRGLGANGEGIPYDSNSSTSLPGGTDLHLVGYAGSTDPHHLQPAHYRINTHTDDVKNNTIVLQNQIPDLGYYGSPAFLKGEDGTYKVVGLTVGSVDGKDRLVPIKNVLN